MESENPYEATANPYPAGTPIKPGEEMKIATQGKRLVNLIIDNVVIQVLGGIAGFAIGVVYGGMKASQGALEFTAEDEMTLNIIGFVVGISIAIFYFVITEASSQRTVGKLVTGTRVVNADGQPASFGQIVGRAFARLIPFEAFSFLGGSQPVGWHDSLSGTRVIEAR